MADLLAQKAQIEAELKRRGGAAKAPGFAKQLDDINRRIQKQGTAPGDGGAVGITSPPPDVRDDKFTGLTPDQNTTINQQEQGDVALGHAANQQLGQIGQNFQQPFDWGSMPQLPQAPQWQGPAQAPSWDNLSQAGQAVNWGQAPSAPVTGDFNQWRQQQIDLANQDFDAQFSGQFKDQMRDFEQQAYNRGWAPGSENYVREKNRLEKNQADMRRSNSLAAMNQAGTNASQFANVGFQARNQYGQEQGMSFDQANYLRQQGIGERQQQYDQGNTAWRNSMDDAQSRYNAGTQYRNDAIAAQQQQRYMPLNDYNMLRSSISGMPMQNLAFSQGTGMQDDAQAHERWMMQHTPRGGGGGGGGGGDPYMGFGSVQGMWAAQDARNQANQMWAWQNDPRFRQPSGPSWQAQMGGQLLGTLGTLGMLGMMS